MILVVGEAPSRTSDPGRPILGGDTGHRLRVVAGGVWAAFSTQARFVNLLKRYPAAGWPRSRARDAAAALEVSFREAPPAWVLLLGRRVAEAFFLTDADFLRDYAMHGSRFSVLPHPSGLSRWWADPVNFAQGREHLREIVATVGSPL